MQRAAMMPAMSGAHSKAHPKLLLFDIDGTILKTGGAGMRAMADIASEMFGDGFRWDGISAAGHLDPLIYAEAMQINGLRHDNATHDQFRTAYCARLAEELVRSKHAVEAMPSVHETLHRLRDRMMELGDVVLGLLTGNYSQAVPIKLSAVDVDPGWFRITAFGDEAPTRPDMVALAIKRYGEELQQTVEPARVMIIGDTPRDVACGKAHGCMVLGVGTGSFTAAQLLAEGADFAVDSLADAAVFWQWLDEA